MPEPRTREVQAECVNKRLTSVGGSSQDETPESVPPVTTKGSALDEARCLAEEIARRGPVSNRLAKELVEAAQDVALDAALSRSTSRNRPSSIRKIFRRAPQPSSRSGRRFSRCDKAASGSREL